MNESKPDQVPGIEGEYDFDGLYVDKYFPKETLLEVTKEFQFRPEDILIATFPKSGTTWTQEILYLMFNNVDTVKAKESPVYKRVPFLECHVPGHPTNNLPILDKMESPRLIKTHLIPRMLQRALDCNSKFVVIFRNPKDALVSYYHHYKLIYRYQGNWNDYFKLYLEGRITFGNIYDHMLAWWGERHRKNVMFLKYEDMKEDLKPCLKQLEAFLQCPLTQEQMDTIVDHTSLKKMKENPATNYRAKPDQGLFFIRKGEVGDWKNHFTVAQNEYMDAECEKKMKNSGLEFRYVL